MRFESGQDNIYFPFQLAANSFSWRKQSTLPLVSPRNEVWGTKAKIYTDDGSLTRSRISTSDWFKANFLHGTFNESEDSPLFCLFSPLRNLVPGYPDLGSDTSSVWNISARSSQTSFLGKPVGVSRNIGSWVINIIFYANLVHFVGTFLGILSQH